MTAYRDFISDFPTRCQEILRAIRKTKSLGHRDVTVMLSIASAGFIVPFERLKPDHPLSPNSNDAEAHTRLRELLERTFLGSELWPDSAQGWYFEHIRDCCGDPDSWKELQHPKPVEPTAPVAAVLHPLRNALAHGSIVTRNDPIGEIVFISKVNRGSNRLQHLTTSPSCFGLLLDNWLAFTASLRLRREGTDSQAA